MSSFSENDWGRPVYSRRPQTTSSWPPPTSTSIPEEEIFHGTSSMMTRTEFEENGGFQKTRVQMMAEEIEEMKNDNGEVKAFLYELQKDRDKLRIAMRKMKVENGRLKAKLKRIRDLMKSNNSGTSNQMEVVDCDDDIDFERIGNFLLVGGPKDPLDIQYTVNVVEQNNCEHKSGERYLWYKMAEMFNDTEAMGKVLTVDDSKIEDVLNNIKNYEQTTWDAAKMKLLEEYERLKFNQHRQLKCLLIKTAPAYLAFSCQDKIFGTGWRKQRSEADRPQMWDGQNLGGKLLMRLRDEFASEHVWTSTGEDEETQKVFTEHCQKNTWKRIAVKRRNTSSNIRTTDESSAADQFFRGSGYMSFDPSTFFRSGMGKRGNYRGRGRRTFSRRY